jgi:hypothetical protein
MNAVARHGVSIASACRAFEISETCYRYSPVMSDENEEIADWECHELCVSGLAHAGFRYSHALKRSSNIMAK